MKKIIALICFLAITTSGFSQTDKYSQDVETCIENNGTIKYYEEKVIDGMFNHLKTTFESQNVPDEVWKELREGDEVALDDLIVMIVSAYKAHYTQEDVINLNKLYSTKAGKRMIDGGDLTEGDQIILKEFYQSDTGQKVMSSQDSMNTSLSEITQLWSGNLYQSVLAKLSEKGFNI